MSSTNKNFKPLRILDDQRAFVFYSIRERVSLVKWSNPNENIQIIDCTKVEHNCALGWDAAFKSGNTYFIAEIKNRDHIHTYFPNWIIEKDKFDCLMKELNTDKAREKGTIPLYLNFFRDKVVGWDVSGLKESDFVLKELSKKTVNGCKDKKNKLVAQLLIKDALFIEDFKTIKSELDSDAMISYSVFFPGNKLKI